MIVLVCGGRDYGDAQRLGQVLDALHKLTPFTRVVHGNARGTDRLAGAWAAERKIAIAAYPANWRKHGPRAAGPIRNQQMLDAEQPNLVVAFPGGRGTADMVARATAAGVRVVEIR